MFFTVTTIEVPGSAYNVTGELHIYSSDPAGVVMGGITLYQSAVLPPEVVDTFVDSWEGGGYRNCPETI